MLQVRASFLRQTGVIATVLLLGSLVAVKAVERAQASPSPSGSPSCTQQASQVRHQSLASGFSQAGALSQAENALARCLINR